MTPEAQRIAIAEACGWHSIVPSGRLDGQLVGRHPEIPDSLLITRKGIEPPDYLSDLNAMHEAEKVLVWQDKIDIYSSQIERVVGTNRSFPLITSNAAQRAEAFLRTLNLWKDE